MPTSGALDYDVFVTEPIPVNNPYPLPNGEQQVTPPLASTLIFGDTDAVLVDVPATSAHADLLGNWVQASGKRLRHIFITHGHGDHWFGLARLLTQFPDADVIASSGAISMMAAQGSAEMREQLWDPMFPGRSPKPLCSPTRQPATSSPLKAKTCA